MALCFQAAGFPPFFLAGGGGVCVRRLVSSVTSEPHLKLRYDAPQASVKPPCPLLVSALELCRSRHLATGIWISGLGLRV